MNKQMPFSIDIEKATLGALIVYPSSMREAVEMGLAANDFYLDGHKRIYTCMLELYEAQTIVDIATVTSKLEAKNQLNFIGGVEYLFQLTEHAVSSGNSRYHIKMVKDKAHLRWLIETAQKIADDTLSNDVELDDALNEAEKELLAVTRNRNTSDFRRGAEVVDTVIAQINERSEKKTTITGLETGFRDFDYMTAGLQRGDLLILAARPSVGKTAFALNLGLNCAKRQRVTALFSLEMPAEQLITRMLSNESLVDLFKLKTGHLSVPEWSQVNNGANQLKGCPIFIDDSSTIKVGEIFSKCRKLKNDNSLDLIIIDYLQLISGSNSRSSENRQQEISEISRSLKQLAREMDVPVIALSQLSRSVEKRESGRPMLSDLRESGSIEQDADIVMFLHREDYQKKAEEGVNTAISDTDVIFAKHRNGAIGDITLAFDKSKSKFYNKETM